MNTRSCHGCCGQSYVHSHKRAGPTSGTKERRRVLTTAHKRRYRWDQIYDQNERKHGSPPTQTTRGRFSEDQLDGPMRIVRQSTRTQAHAYTLHSCEHAYMGTCIHKFMCTYAYVRARAHRHTHTHLHMCEHACTGTCTHMCICMRTQAHQCIQMRKQTGTWHCIHTCIRASTCTRARNAMRVSVRNAMRAVCVCVGLFFV